jgi:hypothetical protein
MTFDKGMMNDDYFEKLAAKFVVLVARTVPGELTSSIFASPLSVRNSDNCMLWHPGYRNNHRVKLFIVLSFSVFSESLKGVVRLMTNIKSFEYAIYGKIKDSILVIVSLCGIQNTNGEYKTAYVKTDKDDALFVFGPYKSCGINSVRVENLLLTEKFLLVSSLVKSTLFATARLDCKISDKVLLVLKWLSWALSLRWLHDYYLEKSLSEIVERYNTRKIGCIHEMHSHARIVWRVAKRFKARGYTIQHAAFSDGKRWYFCYSEEIESGLRLPDIIYVHSDRVSNVLKQYYEGTDFYLGCSARYSQWKDVKRSEKKGKYYLFVAGLAGFDNDVLMTTLSRLLDTPTELLPVRLRLHPYAEISYGVKRWIRTSLRNNIIELSNNVSLRDDLENAAVVIGMSSTVLEESLLLGRPVVQLQHPDYREYIDIGGIKGSMKMDYRKLLPKDLIDVSTLKVDHLEARKRLGLENEIVDYKRLFAM